ncbi:hypothetical protein GCM10010336_53870 [Streptomyces goshikiensis]|nr:hypothetical protein GCM10010336_53870 [Streptomyces goshikiensis]
MLEKDRWDDFGFRTTFRLSIVDNEGDRHEVGSVKIADLGKVFSTTGMSHETSLFSLRADHVHVGVRPSGKPVRHDDPNAHLTRMGVLFSVAVRGPRR